MHFDHRCSIFHTASLPQGTPSQKRSGMVRIVEGSHGFICTSLRLSTNGISLPYLSALPAEPGPYLPTQEGWKAELNYKSFVAAFSVSLLQEKCSRTGLQTEDWQKPILLMSPKNNKLHRIKNSNNNIFFQDKLGAAVQFGTDCVARTVDHTFHSTLPCYCRFAVSVDEILISSRLYFKHCDALLAIVEYG